MVMVVKKSGEHVRIKVGGTEVVVIVQEVNAGEVTLAIAAPVRVKVNPAKEIKN